MLQVFSIPTHMDEDYCFIHLSKYHLFYQTCVVGHARYMAVVVEFETYYGSSPHKPMWVRAFHEEMSKMKPKKLPISDIHLHEQFKKYFGYKRAIKYKVRAELFLVLCFR